MKVQFDNAPTNQICIEKIPDTFDVADISIEQNLCFLNSHRVATKYPETEIVEGIIVYVDKDNGAHAWSHVWNILHDSHFDVTKSKIWHGEKYDAEVKEIRYYPIFRYPASDYKNGDQWEFDKLTIENANAINELLSRNTE